MSHVKNVVSYSRLVDICTGYGGKYNPGHQTLQLKAMRALLAEAQSSLQDVSQKRNALSSATNDRTRAFKNLDKLVYQILGTLKAGQVSKDTLANARYYSRLIIGYLKAANDRLPIPSEDNEEESISTRPITQQSYVAKAHNFYRLAQLIQGIELYKTTAPYLQPEALMKTAENLQRLNESWSRAKVALNNARVHRNVILYRGATALLNNASAVKSYVRVEFGARSQQASELSKLSFIKLKVR